MSNILRELYEGSDFVTEKSTSKEQKDKLRDVLKYEDKILEKLGEGGAGVLNNYSREIEKLSGICNTDTFVTGFKMGARIIYETLVKE
jgi:hypothetical protein